MSILPGRCCDRERAVLAAQEVENDLRVEMARLRHKRRKRDERIIIAATVVGVPLLCWATQWKSILAYTIGFVLTGAMIYNIILRAQGWPDAWRSPVASLLRFLRVQVVDVNPSV